MAYAREADASLVKPLEGAIVRRFTAGATIEAGEAVCMSADGFVDPASGAAVTTNFVLGIALQDVAVTERVDVVTFGPVVCATGGTPGAHVYISDTAGEPAETAGTKVGIIGIVESATVVFVNPAKISQA
jgi:hypothetical protein